MRFLVGLIAAASCCMGCGASDAGLGATDSSPTTSSVTRSEWARQANALCRPIVDTYLSTTVSEEDALAVGQELFTALVGIGSPDDEVTAVVQTMGDALHSPAMRADLDAMARLGERFDALDSTDCGLLFKSGL